MFQSPYNPPDERVALTRIWRKGGAAVAAAKFENIFFFFLQHFLIIQPVVYFLLAGHFDPFFHFIATVFLYNKSWKKVNVLI